MYRTSRCPSSFLIASYVSPPLAIHRPYTEYERMLFQGHTHQGHSHQGWHTAIDKTGAHFKKKWLSYLFGMPHTSAARSGNISCDRSFLSCTRYFLWPFRETTKRRLKSRLTVKGYFVNLFMCKVAAKPCCALLRRQAFKYYVGTANCRRTIHKSRPDVLRRLPEILPC
jgi:hypothetical protein